MAASVSGSSNASHGPSLTLRALQTRLEVLAALVRADGGNGWLLSSRPQAAHSGSSSVSLDDLVAYCADRDHATFEHANADIRRATEELFAAAYTATRDNTLLPVKLSPYLRPKQREEYSAAFVAAVARSASGDHEAPHLTRDAVNYPSSTPNLSSPGAATGGAGAASRVGPAEVYRAQDVPKHVATVAPTSTTAAQAQQQASAATEYSHRQDADEWRHAADSDTLTAGTGLCQFCGGCGPGASEQVLDLHYWRDCPMLTACGACGQVVEVAVLHEHLLSECERASDFKECSVCGAAVALGGGREHAASGACVPVTDPHTAARCPLCFGDVAPPNKSGWLMHLLGGRGCPANSRSNGAAANNA